MRHLTLTIVSLLLGASTALALVKPAGAQYIDRSYRLTAAQEQGIAEDMLDELRSEPGIVRRGWRNELVSGIGQQLVNSSRLNEYDYRFFVVDENELNAFATPGGYIYVTKGLVDYLAYDQSMLAAIIAHELGHAEERHTVRGYEVLLRGSSGLGVLGVLYPQQERRAVEVAGYMGDLPLLGYSQAEDEWADQYGAELPYNAGFDPYGLMRGLQVLTLLDSSYGDAGDWLDSHPYTRSRANRAAGLAWQASGRQHGYLGIPQPERGHPLYGLIDWDEAGYNDDNDYDNDYDDDDASSERYQRRGGWGRGRR